jgi:hypothetical protein
MLYETFMHNAEIFTLHIIIYRQGALSAQPHKLPHEPTYYC